MAKGEVIVEGAKAFCSNSFANFNAAAAVPMQVKSQKKKKYFAQGKLIATNKDITADSFNNGQGFGNCYLPDKSKQQPCKLKCKIEYKDFYENVDFDKGMKVLLKSSTGTCKGYGTPGTIEFATSGQTKGVSQIDVKAADAFSILNTSPQWESVLKTKGDKVKAISLLNPTAVKPTGTYYFIQEANAFSPFSIIQKDTYLTLKADYEGDENKIVWGMYKGETIADKVKTFIGIGANFRQSLNKIFEDLEEGKYRFEAYVSKAGDEKCFIIVDYVKDQIEGLTAKGKMLVKNVPMPLSLTYKIDTKAEKDKILNNQILGQVNTSPVALWRITQGTTVLYHSGITTDTSLVDLKVAKNYVNNMPIVTVSFKNIGTYTVEAYTNADVFSAQPHHSVTIKVTEKYGINTIKHSGNGLMRHTDMLQVSVGALNVDYAPGGIKNAQWHLQKNGVWLKTFSDASIAKTTSINKKVNELLQLDAGVYGGEYFGTYVIEAYANAIGKDKKPDFKGDDSYKFEVIRNGADKITLPQSFPVGAKVKYEVVARIMPLIATEKIEIEVPEGVTNNNDGTLTFTKQGEFTITARMTGAHTSDKKVSAKVKVIQPELNHALWAYGTGQKRKLTGYKEETYGYVDITGLENQSIKTKVWVKGDNDNFYNEPEKYMLEERTITLNERGIGWFKIITSYKYKELIDCALPKTSNIDPKHRLVFTIELIPPTGTVTLPEKLEILHAIPIQGTKLYEVLTEFEELTLTTQQQVSSVVFANQDSSDQQRGLTHYGKSHKIWIHTVNMQDEELQIEVMTNTHSSCMDEKDGIIKALDSIKSYPKQKVGVDGLLELDFTLEQKYATDAETNPTYYSIQVAQTAKDPADPKKEILVFLEDQFIMHYRPDLQLVRSQDLKSIGIKTTQTGLTPEEKVTLRKRYIAYKHTALMVTKSTNTVEAISNTDVLVVVDDVEDIEVAVIPREDENKICECEARVRAFMRMLRVGEGTGEVIKSYDKKQKKIVYIPHDFEKGYTTAFDGNKITDLSTHPQKNYGGSTAAGAYQVMRYTWWWINGEDLDDDKQKTGKYTSSHDYIKKYKITDYSPESQDNICLIIIEAQRPKLINKIINNNIESAIKEEGCFIWASLPEDGVHSHYKYKHKLQPATPIATCIEHYNTFLKEELAGKSPLHLKKGFLKEFGYDCCKGDSQNKVLTGCGEKTDIDLRNKMTFQAQKTKTDCNLICREIMSSLNVTPENPTESGNQSFYQTAIESENNTSLNLNNDDFVNGMNYIDKSLEAGYPVMVGVNHTLNYGYNETPNTSDHYVIIVGRFCDNNVLKYRFWDVATRRGAEGDFKFILTSEKLYSDDVWKKERTYTLTQVRRNINSKGKLITY
jgi:muramidase (phage lysozyme)